jgi:hypothetical protein
VAVARAADLAGSPSLGGRAVAAAVALHHLFGALRVVAGWDTENGTSVTATDRFRAALPGRRRRRATMLSEQAADDSTSLRAERISLVSDYIGGYPEDENERSRCSRAFHPPEAPLEQAAG